MSSTSLRRHVFPVVHYRDHALAIEQAQLAWSAGADGVFLIDHAEDDAAVMRAAAVLLPLRPAGKLLGVNLLAADPLASVDVVADAGADMLWGDQPGIHSTGEGPAAVRIARRLTTLERPLEYFASVAFKGQPHDPDPVASALRAQALGMVPTTSGTGTGKAPDVSKMSAIAAGLTERGTRQPPRLAVASGMDCDNVALFLPYVTDILVATGVSADEHHFDERKLARFIAIIAEYNAANAG